MLAVADDDLRARMRAVLDALYLIDDAADGRVALSQIQAFPPDVVVADADLPGLDGFGLLHALRADASLQAIPLVLLTTRSSGEFAIEGLEAVADDYLEKPFPSRELVARVRTHIEFARSRAAWAAELARAQDELSRMRRAHHVFHEVVRRDLRVPLRAIEGFSRGVLERHGGTLDPRTNRHLERIHAGARRMDSMIADLTELSRIAEATIHAEWVNLSETARRVFDELVRGSPERPIALEAAPDLVVHGDRRLLVRAVECLIEHSWRTTLGEASARIVVGRGRHAGKDALFVADNGPGFDPEDAEHLFVPYQQIGSGSGSLETGIGLAIARQVLERHGGEIWATGEPGRGATFWFSVGSFT